jgi:ribosomal protein S18 acetylase RimI-like enzyme
MANPVNERVGAADSAASPAFRTVREATARDAATLAAVAAETFPLACPPHTLPESIAAFIAAHLSEASFDAYLTDPQRVLFLAEVDGAAAGYTMLVLGEPADPDVAAAVTVRPTAELSKVYVRQGFHGGGLAAQLVGRSVDAARERGAASVWLGVNQENARANRFYEKQGFALAGTKRFLVGDRYEDDFVRVLGV